MIEKEAEGQSSNYQGKSGLFLLAVTAGTLLIYFNSRINFDFAIYLPSVVVALYAAIIRGVLGRIENPEHAEHQIDSVYFLGFLFTLISLVSLFAGFSLEAESIFLYLGISVSTSIAGVLFRNILRGSYLADRAGGESTERSEQLLAAIADALEPMREYLSERNGKRELLSSREDAALESLGRFTELTESFSSSLAQSRELLSRQMESYSCALSGSEEGLKRMNEITLFLGRSAEEMDRFSRGTRELNIVLDGLLCILEEKVEKVV